MCEKRARDTAWGYDTTTTSIICRSRAAQTRPWRGRDSAGALHSSIPYVPARAHAFAEQRDSVGIHRQPIRHRTSTCPFQSAPLRGVFPLARPAPCPPPPSMFQRTRSAAGDEHGAWGQLKPLKLPQAVLQPWIEAGHQLSAARAPGRAQAAARLVVLRGDTRPC